jgi:hypothetical protein
MCVVHNEVKRLDREREEHCVVKKRLKRLKILRVLEMRGGEKCSIHEAGGHLHIKYKNHKASHVLTCCLTKIKRSSKNKNKPKTKEFNITCILCLLVL